MTVLPEKLARYVDDDRLAENAANYPEMQRDLTAGQKAAVQAIRSRLLDIPLTHATRLPVATHVSEGIHPHKLRVVDGSSYHNTHPLDQSLGLDEYVFMYWGGFHKTTGYGSNYIAINTEAIMRSQNTIVSPYDIASRIYSGRCSNFAALAPDNKAKADAYLDSLVSGELWIEISARRVLQTMLTSRSKKVYRIKDTVDFGEIKHYGPIVPELTTHTIESDDDKEHEEWRRMYENGFAPPPVSCAIEFREITLQDPLGYDKTPQAIGVDEERARQVWADILAVARS